MSESTKRKLPEDIPPPTQDSPSTTSSTIDTLKRSKPNENPSMTLTNDHNDLVSLSTSSTQVASSSTTSRPTKLQKSPVLQTQPHTQPHTQPITFYQLRGDRPDIVVESQSTRNVISQALGDLPVEPGVSDTIRLCASSFLQELVSAAQLVRAQTGSVGVLTKEHVAVALETKKAISKQYPYTNKHSTL